MNATSFDVALWACITCSVAADSNFAKAAFLVLALMALIANTAARLRK